MRMQLGFGVQTTVQGTIACWFYISPDSLKKVTAGACFHWHFSNSGVLFDRESSIYSRPHFPYHQLTKQECLKPKLKKELDPLNQLALLIWAMRVPEGTKQLSDYLSLLTSCNGTARHYVESRDGSTNNLLVRLTSFCLTYIFHFADI